MWRTGSSAANSARSKVNEQPIRNATMSSRQTSSTSGTVPADFVRCAMGFDSSVQVAAGGREADAKSLLAVLALGAKGGSDLRLRADGDDAAEALDALAGCVTALA